MKAVVVILFLLVALILILRNNQKRVSEYRMCYRIREYREEATNGNCKGSEYGPFDCDRCPYLHNEMRYDK